MSRSSDSERQWWVPNCPTPMTEERLLMAEHAFNRRVARMDRERLHPDNLPITVSAVVHFHVGQCRRNVIGVAPVGAYVAILPAERVLPPEFGDDELTVAGAVDHGEHALALVALRIADSAIAILGVAATIAKEKELVSATSLALLSCPRLLLAERYRLLQEYPNLLNQMAAGGANPFSELEEGDALRLQQKFGDRGKRQASKAIGRMRQVEAERELENFRPVIEKLRAHLFPAPAAAE